MKRGLALLAVAVAALSFVTPTPARAHATLIDSEPPPGAVLTESPSEVRLTFDESVITVFAAVRVLDASGTTVVERRPTATDDGSVVRAPLPPLADGTYVVVWRVTSRDGHPVQGSVVFQVGGAVVDLAAIGDAYATEEHGLDLLFNVIRWATMLGVVVLLGAAWLALGSTTTQSARSRIVLLGGWLLALVGTLQALVAYGPHASGRKIYAASDLGLLADTLSTTFGRVTAARLVVLVVVGLVLGRLVRSRASLVAVAVPLLASMSLAGHPLAQSPAAVSVAVDALHLGAVSAWLGGLAAIALDSQRWLADETAIRRFSRTAFVAVPLVAVTGLVQATIMTDGPTTLTEHRYGRLLLVKVSVVAVMVALGWVARRVLARGGAASLRSTVTVEAVLGVAVVAITAVLAGVPPSAATSIEPFVGTEVRADTVVQVTVTPARVGVREVHVVLTTPRGALERVSGVRLRVSLPERSIPTSPIGLREVGPNHHLGSANFAFEGTWRLEVLVAPDDATTLSYVFEVPIGP